VVPAVAKAVQEAAASAGLGTAARKKIALI